MRYIRRIKGAGFILWHARHEFYHVLCGLIWAWVLRELWQEFNLRFIGIAIFGSLLPDIEHFTYFLTYGKRHQYTKNIIKLLKSRSWRSLTLFVEKAHKYNTDLSYHNIYFTIVLLTFALLSSLVEWRAGVILFGAMVIHYLFDIVDDLIILGYVNKNWKRWGRDRHSSGLLNK
jgi:hypothetical protein